MKRQILSGVEKSTGWAVALEKNEEKGRLGEKNCEGQIEKSQVQKGHLVHHFDPL